MIVGGMPQAVAEYVESKDLASVDRTKRDILELYKGDIAKHGGRMKTKIGRIFSEIPSQLQRHEKKFQFSTLGKSARYRDYADALFWLREALLVNVCTNSSEPNVVLRLAEENSSLKCYFGDTGLLISHAFDENALAAEDIHRRLMFDKIELNEGMLVENIVAQMLTATGRTLHFYSENDLCKAENRMEIDFLIANTKIGTHDNFAQMLKSLRCCNRSVLRGTSKTNRLPYGLTVKWVICYTTRHQRDDTDVSDMMKTNETRATRGYNCVVCVKQVPDTKKVTGEAMKADGTINRAALPAIFNPEDLNALEAALSVKERYGGKVTAIAMGLPAACDVLREALMRGADEAYLVTDRKAAGSDTLATSYILSQAVKRFKPDLVFCGRQAIDGDTAQTGPQIAEKLGVPAITYLEKIEKVEEENVGGESRSTAVVVRDIGTGIETDRVTLPALFTVTEKFGEARPMDVRRVMKYKNFEPPHLSCDDIGCEPERCGFAGSPTSVNKIVSVVLAGGDYKAVEPTDEGLGALVKELVAEHTIG